MLLECHVLTMLVPVTEVRLALTDLVILLQSLTMVWLPGLWAFQSMIVALSEVRIWMLEWLASLLGKDSIEFDVAVVHHEVFRHESF